MVALAANSDSFVSFNSARTEASSCFNSLLAVSGVEVETLVATVGEWEKAVSGCKLSSCEEYSGVNASFA